MVAWGQVYEAACGMLARSQGQSSISTCAVPLHMLPPLRAPDISVLVDAHRAKASVQHLLMASLAADLQRNLSTSEPASCCLPVQGLLGLAVHAPKHSHAIPGGHNFCLMR